MHDLVQLDDEQIRSFGARPLVAKHALHEHPLFDDAHLVELLDRWPRRHLYALTMGEDPARPDENVLAVHDGVSGKDLLEAVKKGRLWLNCTHAEEADPRLRDLVAGLYAELQARVPGFRVLEHRGTLLVSSPRALVYFHVDGPPSLLWHVRGKKRVWVYPALDERLVPRPILEDVFAGARHEYVPWEPWYDDEALVLDLEPGMLASWPHNAPHRVTNGDELAVSLSTDHYTPDSRMRARVYRANRWLRTVGLGAGRTIREQGARAAAKIALHMAARALGLDGVRTKRHAPKMRVEPTAERGVVPLR